MPPETKKALGLALSVVSLVKGLFVVHVVMPKMTLAISSSALGAAWLTGKAFPPVLAASLLLNYSHSNWAIYVVIHYIQLFFFVLTYCIIIIHHHHHYYRYAC